MTSSLIVPFFPSFISSVRFSVNTVKPIIVIIIIIIIIVIIIIIIFFLFLFFCFAIISQGQSRLGPVSRKSRKLFGPEKPFVKLRPAYSAKLVFSYVVKGIKIKITAKFGASRRLRFEDTKRIMSPEMRPKSLGTFEKQAPGFSSKRNYVTIVFPIIQIICTYMENVYPIRHEVKREIQFEV